MSTKQIQKKANTAVQSKKSQKIEEKKKDQLKKLAEEEDEVEQSSDEEQEESQELNDDSAEKQQAKQENKNGDQENKSGSEYLKEIQIDETEEKEDVTFQSLGVCEELVEACNRLKYVKPTAIQRESLVYTLKQRDIIALAETGSGKTLAFALPVIQNLLDAPQPFYALVLSPTRELCMQIAEHFEALGVGISLKTTVIVGGLDPMAQAIALSKKPHIIIGTPGRILYHMQNTKGFNFKALKFLVLDEADKLLNMDFEKDINQILDIIPKKRNTFLFSATMTNKVHKLQRASLKDPVKIEVSSKYQMVSTLVAQYAFIPAKYKDCYLVYSLNEFAGNTSIIFVQTCLNAIKLTLMLRNLGFSAVTIHGQMSQVKRLGAINKFKSGEKKILVATDVASRGLDIPSVDLVINYDIPTNAKEYVHRVGRTARAGRAGKAISFVTQYDVEMYLKIEALIGKKLDQYKCEEYQVLVFNERVQEAQRIAAQEIKEIMEKKNNPLHDVDDEGEKYSKKNANNNRKKSFNNSKNMKKMKIDI
ncbi:DEAD/DEAH-box helicase (macronuclear) [Tetrahymena thermophila SB210]|uniref:DEAD/DEAH-box helicase n=1 Tax=Tetrahymena thermophila (strain SB210) TaxID=312017 RepID=Q234Z6_TETTS|nr:DEAD/DEAH-box helicase [Tetrahymena thermophila SB210]EAR91857.2 DEAD/DEAH-box helicase [Tetrahymena thermophila SB210]|eukprot:XP_001012102.2 DEAD/DEAH-box helicase [Tetrahymena thermophila SB210]